MLRVMNDLEIEQPTNEKRNDQQVQAKQTHQRQKKKPGETQKGWFFPLQGWWRASGARKAEAFVG